VNHVTECQENAADGVEKKPKTSGARRSAMYLATAFVVTTASLSIIMEANRRYAPEMYRPAYMETVADAFTNDDNFAVFDLNINIRKLREEQWKRLGITPSLIVLGASQWQEASADLMPDRSYLNGHIHRDYYEDVLGMVELLVRHDKLPKDLVITIRDRLFTPVAKRTDYLWLPGIPYYQAMAKRLSLPPLNLVETRPLQRPRELLSLSMLFENVTRWHKAADRPDATENKSHANLDVLHPDGSITWSEAHLAAFTPERARKLAIAHADASYNNPPVIDPKGVEALDRLLSYLGVKGVRVHLAHPPFNPIYFERVKNSPYMDGLRQVEAVTRELAKKHKLGLAGSFDPDALGCSAEMFIDAEHSNANCLRGLLADVADSIDMHRGPISGDSPAGTVTADSRLKKLLLVSGWTESERSNVGADGQNSAGDVAAGGGTTPSGTSIRQQGARDLTKTSSSRPSAALPKGGQRVGRTGDATEKTPRNVIRAAKQARKASHPRVGTREPRDRKVVSRQSRAQAATSGLLWPGDAPGRRN